MSDDLRFGVATELFLPERPSSRDIRVATLSIEFEHRISGGLWLRGALGPAVTRGDRIAKGEALESDDFGVGTVASLRHYLIERGTTSPYLEGGVGLLFTRERFPPDGTAWNFSYRVGAGLDIGLWGDLRLSVGFRRAHFSNAMGRARNPAYNGDGVAVGLSW